MKNEIKLAKIARLELNGYSDQAASNKDVYLELGRMVLRSLAKELGLREYRVSINRAGVAVSGDITLIGIWDDNNGIYVNLSSPGMFKQNGEEVFYWRSARHMKDYTGGHNRNMSYGELAEGVEAAATQMRWQLGR